ncbi:hypothetical protein SBV1_2860008 [Verrucomicrobia bacterium]|nr:hypothetical protein SBV1_2860008 [Verrucomicrobiota bacterium]
MILFFINGLAFFELALNSLLLHDYQQATCHRRAAGSKYIHKWLGTNNLRLQMNLARAPINKFGHRRTVNLADKSAPGCFSPLFAKTGDT